METKKTLIIVSSIIAVIGIGIKITNVILTKKVEASVTRIMQNATSSKDSTFISKQHHLKYVFNTSFLHYKAIQNAPHMLAKLIHQEDGLDKIMVTISARPELEVSGYSIYDQEVEDTIHACDLYMANRNISGYSTDLVSSCKRSTINGIDFLRSEFKTRMYDVATQFQIMYYFINHGEMQMVCIFVYEDYLKAHPNVETELINNLYILP